MPDVQMPDGTVIQGVPDGITQSELLSRYQKMSSQSQNVPEKPGLFSSITGPISDFIDSQRQRGADLNNAVNATSTAPTGSEQTPGETAGQFLLHNVLGGLAQAPVAAAKVAGNMAADMTPQSIKDVLSNGVRAVAQSPIGQEAGQIANAYNQNQATYDAQNPRAARNFQAAKELANVLPLGVPEVRGAIDAGTDVAAQALKNVGTDVASSVGNNIADTAARVTVGRDADQILAGRLKGMDLSEIKDKLAASGDTAMLPDVTGDEVKGLMRAVGTMTGGAKQIVSDALENRSEGAVKRVSDALSKNVSNVDTYFTNLDDMANARAAIASPMYQEAFSKNKNIMTPEINRIINTPAGQSALKSAANKMQNDMTLLGVPDKDLAEQAKLAGTYQPGTGGIASGFKLRTLDYMKRSLDDQIGVAQRTGEKDNARILTGLKNQLVTALDKADVTAKAGSNSLKPEGGLYARARKVYSDSFSLENAQQEGVQFSNRAPEEISKFIASASPAEKEAYRIGVRKNLQDIVNKTPDGADPAKRVFGNTQKREQLKAVFGDGDNLKEFSQRMREEIAAAHTKQKVLGGSRTDINLADDGQFIQEAMKVAQQGVTARLTHAVGTAVYNKYIGMTKKNANSLAYILTNKQQGLDALDRLMKKEKSKYQRELINQALLDNKVK